MKRILSSKFIAAGMALLLVISVLGTSVLPAEKAFAADQNQTTTAAVTVTEAAYAAAEAILSRGIQSDWQAIALIRGGSALPASYKTSLENDIRSQKGTYTNVTDYARRVLAATATGIDATNIAGYDLVEKIYNNGRMTNQGLNGVIYSLLALDSGQYTVPAAAAWSQDKLLSEILSKQNADGGFTLSTGASDPDVTAMALTALSAHLDQPEVKTAAGVAVAWLAQKQQAHGGYGDSSESVAQVILALTSSGIDPTESRFTKEGHHLIDRLLSFRTADGGFAHTLAGGYNTLATEQALQALVAYQLYAKGERFYNFPQPVKQPAAVQATVVIEGPQGFIAEGKVQSASALAALQTLTADQKVALELTSSAYGDYVSGIQGIKAGVYGGYDGWNFAVSRAGQWIFPSVGMSEFVLQSADRVLVYYGDSGTQLVSGVTVTPSPLSSGKSFTVNVQKSSLDWESGKTVTVPAAAVQVKVGNAAVVTDAAGTAVIPAGTAVNGAHTLTVTGYSEGKVPSVARYTKLLLISPVFADEKQISSWAAAAVRQAFEKGLMEGVSSNGLSFAPKEYITRAQFAALLLRLTDNAPAAASAVSPFSDVQPNAWYYGYVLKARELGILQGVTAASFNPNGHITRQDMAVMIARAFKLDESPSTRTFKDQAAIGGYALSSVNAVADKGYMTDFNGSFDPAAAVTREMAAVVSVRLANSN